MTMSDQNSPFGPPTSTDVAEPEQEAAPAGSNRPKPVVFVVAGAIVLVLALAAYFLVFSGGGSDTTSGGAVTPGQVRVSTLPSAKETPSAAPTVAVAGGATGSGLDPFRAAPSPKASASGTAAASASASSTSTTGSGGTAGVTSTLLVNSVSISSRTASVTVDGKTMTVGQGLVFAKYYKMSAVITGSAQCAVFTFGDLPAQLCKGQQATFTG
jgi:hypothetical protein